jgi:carbon monoxide dehydrogenase subunit G
MWFFPGGRARGRRDYWSDRGRAQAGEGRGVGAAADRPIYLRTLSARPMLERLPGMPRDEETIIMAGPLNADTFHVSRSILIDAPPEAIFPHIDDFHAWAAWSPYEKMDANLAKTFTGPARGVGAGYAWVGRKAGSGRMEITQSNAPSKVVIKFDFTRPMTAHNTAEFTLEPQGGATRVTWAMHGPNTLMSKVMGLFFSMDKLVGPQFDEGLASLKALSETVRVA